MNDTSSEQDRYLALAREASAAADQMKDHAAQTIMRGIANGYLAMANTAEKRERTMPGARKRSPESD